MSVLSSSPRVAEVLGWLLSRESRGLAPAPFVEGLVERFRSAGLPVERLTFSVPTMHPELLLLAVFWRRGSPVGIARRDHHLRESSDYLGSPVHALHRGLDRVRCRLVGPEADLSYPVCREIQAQGFTDYAAFALEFAHQDPSFVSFATQQAGGFSDQDLADLHHLRPAFAIRVELAAAALAKECLLEVYLGRNAARRVLQGQFRRGSGEVLPAAILFCDMRGFTAMADVVSPQEMVRTLDALFDRIVGPVHARGGEVLKFIGDAVLAVFTEDEGGPSACRAALDAAREALLSVERWNGERLESGLPPVGVGVALHRGEVLYGNVGAQDRLDFTVIGPAVNEASRVESMCKALGVPLLLTGALRANLGDVPVRSLGRHPLRGVSEPVELYTVEVRAAG